MADVLQELSNALAAVVESGGQSVVRVDGRRRIPATGVVWSADGVIVTASHVVHNEENIQVGLPNGEQASAALVGRDPSTDIAVLRAEASGLTPATWSADGETAVGHIVLALGRPGRTVQATQGIVSALGNAWRTHGGGHIDRYLQTDVVMYPGFSGGPLANVFGQFAGLNSSHLMRGVSLTMPPATLERVVGTLLEHGRIRRGYLGVGAQPAQLPEGLATELKQDTGLLVVSVDEGSPAQAGGLLLGDTIVAFNGEPVRHLDDLLGRLSGDTVGVEIPVRVLRGGALQVLTVTVGERPAGESHHGHGHGPGGFGSFGRRGRGRRGRGGRHGGGRGGR